jgi:hypothetical protein
MPGLAARAAPLPTSCSRIVIAGRFEAFSRRPNPQIGFYSSRLEFSTFGVFQFWIFPKRSKNVAAKKSSAYRRALKALSSERTTKR